MSHEPIVFGGFTEAELRAALTAVEAPPGIVRAPVEAHALVRTVLAVRYLWGVESGIKKLPGWHYEVTATLPRMPEHDGGREGEPPRP